MPKFQLEKSININASATKVRAAIQDYQQWTSWSPWLCMEPSAKVDFEGSAAQIGHAYSWDGDMVGSGRMELAEVVGDIDKMDLTFLKPFKSKAKVHFQTTAIDTNNTRVTWGMDSGLPFFLFFMIDNMKTMIGMDYERGLKLLKEHVETGSVTSKSEIAGIVDVPEIHFTGVKVTVDMQDIHTAMDASIAKAVEQAAGKMTEDTVGSIYHNMDIKRQICEYTSFVPVSKADSTGTIPTCKALKVVHTGSYQHLGNAWSTANNHQRHKKMKKNKQVSPFELYTNDPDKVAEADLITELYIPINA